MRFLWDDPALIPVRWRSCEGPPWADSDSGCGSWLVAAGYTVAFVALQHVMPFSLASPWFVVTAMIRLLGLAFVAQPLVMMTMPWFLRTIRAREVHGGFYRAVGVPVFGRLLRLTPLRLFNMDVYLRDGLADTTKGGRRTGSRGRPRTSWRRCWSCPT